MLMKVNPNFDESHRGSITLEGDEAHILVFVVSAFFLLVVSAFAIELANPPTEVILIPSALGSE